MTEDQKRTYYRGLEERIDVRMSTPQIEVDHEHAVVCRIADLRARGVQASPVIVRRGDHYVVHIQLGDGTLEYVQDPPAPITLRALQEQLPWLSKYSADFEADPRPHKHFSHALHHVTKAAGHLTELEDALDHGARFARLDVDGRGTETAASRDFGKFVADLVILAVRLAKEFPGGEIDLERAVADRIAEKNGGIVIGGAK